VERRGQSWSRGGWSWPRLRRTHNDEDAGCVRAVGAAAAAGAVAGDRWCRRRSPAPPPSSPTTSSRRSSCTPPIVWRPAPTSWRPAPRAAQLAQLARRLRAGPRPTRGLAHAQPHVVGAGPGPVRVHPVSKKRWCGVRVRVASREDRGAGMRREAQTRARFKTLDVVNTVDDWALKQSVG
jgi:hypothetical protein